MASRYWVGGAATWDATAGSKWSTTSGGASGAATPTAADDVFFDAASGAVTVTTSGTTVMNCRSLDFTGFTGTFNHAASTTVRIGDSSAPVNGMTLYVSAGMTYTIGSLFNSAFQFLSTNATTQTIWGNGKTLPSITLNGVGATWKPGDALVIGNNATLSLLSGTFDTDNKTFSTGNLTSGGSLTRVLTLGSSTVNINSNSGFALSGTNLTFSAGTSHINCSNSGGGNFAGNGNTFYDVTLCVGNGSITGANTYNNLTFLTFNQAIAYTQWGANQTINGTLTVPDYPANAANRVLFTATSTAGITITAAAVSLKWVDFAYITGAGAAAPFTGTRLGDCGGNSGITTDTPRTLYWSDPGGGGGFAWHGSTVWSLTSGGVTKTSDFPLPQDNAIFDSASAIPASRTIMLSVPRCCKNMDFTGVPNAGTLILSASEAYANTNVQTGHIYGDLTLASGMTTGGSTALAMGGGINATLTTNGATFGANFAINKFPASTVTLADALNGGITRTLQFVCGTIDNSINNVNVTFGLITVATAATINFGSATYEATGTGTCFSFNGSSSTLTMGTSIFRVSNTTATSKSFSASLGTLYFNRIEINGDAVTIGSAIRVKHLAVNTAGFTTGLLLGAGSTNFVMEMSTNGSSGNLAKFGSTSASITTLRKGGGIISLDYVTITYVVATGGATYYAGANSTSSGTVTGWIFRSGAETSPNNTGMAFFSPAS